MAAGPTGPTGAGLTFQEEASVVGHVYSMIDLRGREGGGSPGKHPGGLLLY